MLWWLFEVRGNNNSCSYIGRLFYLETSHFAKAKKRVNANKIRAFGAANFHAGKHQTGRFRKVNLLAQRSTKDGEKSRRQRERFALSLPVRVYCRESLDHEWLEMSRLVDVTPFGARLRLKRPTEAGRLLQLTLPMPRPLRCFDYAEDQYRVWSLVRSVRLLDPGSERGALMEIGLAFVGKRPPRSFEADPARRYEIAQSSTKASLWSVKEESSETLSEVSVSDKRKDTRHSIPIEVLIEVFAKDGTFSESEKTVTENINQHGASVFTTLDLSPGRFVRLSSEQYRTAALAVVRDRRAGADGIGRLHLEFVGSEWPLGGSD